MQYNDDLGLFPTEQIRDDQDILGEKQTIDTEDTSSIGKWAAEQFKYGTPKEEIETQFEGLKIPVYEPADVIADAFSFGLATPGRMALKLLLRGGVKEGAKVLAKGTAKELGYGAMAGLGMAGAGMLGGGAIIETLSGFMGPMAAGTLASMSRRGLVLYFRSLKRYNKEQYAALSKAIKESPESPLSLKLKETIETKDPDVGIPTKDTTIQLAEDPARSVMLRPEGVTRGVRISTTGNIRAQSLYAKEPKDIASTLANLRKFSGEQVYMVAKDKDGKILEIHKFGKGIKAQAVVSTSDMAGRALNIPGTKTVSFVHTHGSGEAIASKADNTTSLNLQNLLKAGDIESENIIIAGTQYGVFAPAKDFSTVRTFVSDIPPAHRKLSIPVKEKFNLPDQALKNRAEITNESILKSELDSFGAKDSGILLTDVRNRGLYLQWPFAPP